MSPPRLHRGRPGQRLARLARGALRREVAERQGHRHVAVVQPDDVSLVVARGALEALGADANPARPAAGTLTGIVADDVRPSVARRFAGAAHVPARRDAALLRSRVTHGVPAARDAGPASIARERVRGVEAIVALAYERAEVRARCAPGDQAGVHQRRKSSPRAHQVAWLSGTHGVYM